MSSDTIRFIFLKKNPVKPIAIANIPIVHIRKDLRIIRGDPINRRLGSYTKANGTRKPAKASFVASHPVFIGSDPAMLAPAYAETHTGGVTHPITA